MDDATTYVRQLADELARTDLDPLLIRAVDAFLGSPPGAEVLAVLDRISTGQDHLEC